MYSNVHCFCFVLFFHFIILIRQSKKSFDEICQRETGFKEKKIRRRISDVHFYIGLWNRTKRVVVIRSAGLK